MLYLLKKDIKELFGSKKRIGIMTVVLIILIISTSSNALNEKRKADNRIQFGLADEDQSVYSKMLIEYFRDSESFSAFVNILEGSATDLEHSFYNGELDVFLQIPEGFAENMIVMNHLPVRVLISTKDISKSVIIKNVFASYEKYIQAVEVNCTALYDLMTKFGMEKDLINKTNVEISYDLIFTALGKEKFFDYKEISGYPSSNLFSYYNYAFISILLNFIGLYAGFLMLKERRSGILKRLYTTGTGIFTILGEKILFAVGVVFLVILLAYFILGALSGSNLSLEFAAILLVSTLFATCFSITLSGIFTKIRDYVIGGNFFCFLFAVLGGGVIPISFFPESILKISILTPNYWLIRVVLSLQSQNGIELFNRYMLASIAGSILLFIVAVYLYKREVISYEE